MSEGGGRFRASSITAVIAGIGVLFALGGVAAIVFGLAGGPALLDPPQDAARAVEIAAFGVQLMWMAGCFLLAMSGIVLGIWLLVRLRNRRHRPQGAAENDPFAWIAYALGHRSATWTGEVAGRRITARSYHRRYAASGQQLSVRLDVPTRLAWTRRTGVGEMVDAAAGVASTPGEPYGYPEIAISAAEPEWAHRLLARPEVREAVHVLADGQPVFLITLRPGRLLFALPHGTAVRIDTARAARWANALLTLAAAADGNGPPAAHLERNALERAADALDA